MSRQSCIVGASVLWVTASMAAVAMADVSLQPAHPGNRLAGLRVLGLRDGVLTVECQRAASGLVVLRSDQPLVVEAAEGGRARLIPGWDGTLGYSHYGLELSVPGPGKITVRLRWLPPPREPSSNTVADTAAFLREFQSRASRFPDRAEEFRAWQRCYREKLAGWLMNGRLPGRVPIDARVLSEEKASGFTLRRVEYRSQADRRNTLLLSLPHNVGKAPLLLALHGHEAPWGQADAGAFRPGHADDFCAYFAERGWAVLQPATMNHTLQHAGWTLQGEWTWDALVALDYAATVRGIDMDRVAVCGLSTGAHLAMDVLALDERVKAGVVGCVLSTWNHSRRRFRIPPHCDCGIGLQLGTRLEPCDWAVLAAPKPVQFQHGRQDACFCPGADPKRLDLRWNTGVMPVSEYQAIFAEVQRGYALAGRREAVCTVFHDAGHRVDNEAALPWLNAHLSAQP